MTDFQDLDIQRTPDPGVPRTPRRTGLIIAAGLLGLAAGAAIYVVFFRGAESDNRVAVAEREVAATPERAETAPPPELPPLDEMDPLVRSLVGALSAHPQVAAWLTTDNLVRNFVDVVDAIAAGGTPARHLQVLAPPRAFAVTDRGETTIIDPGSFARYDALADAFSSIDPAAAADLYATLRPRLEEAYQQRFVGGTFHDRLQRAIAVLAATPTPPAEILVVPRGVGYAYADADLESRSGAQKHLMRMGPRNARIVKEQLREIARALGSE